MLQESPGPLDDYALATRLSYFLWNTLPDDTLTALADNRTLSQPAVLHAQVERMLNDPRAARLVENFLGQWLNLARDRRHTAGPQALPRVQAVDSGGDAAGGECHILRTAQDTTWASPIW